MFPLFILFILYARSRIRAAIKRAKIFADAIGRRTLRRYPFLPFIAQGPPKHIIPRVCAPRSTGCLARTEGYKHFSGPNLSVYKPRDFISAFVYAQDGFRIATRAHVHARTEAYLSGRENGAFVTNCLRRELQSETARKTSGIARNRRSVRDRRGNPLTSPHITRV